MKVWLSLVLVLGLIGSITVFGANQHPVMSTSMSDCADTGGNHLNYTAAAGMSCGTSSTGSLPAGIIVFTASTCPATWTEYTAAQGFAVVGLPSGGTNAGTVGTAMTNLLDRTHDHTYTQVVNHTHTLSTGTGATGNFSQVLGAVDTSSGGTGGTPTQTALGTLSGNPGGGVATGTTATKATSNVISYIQLRACSKN